MNFKLKAAAWVVIVGYGGVFDMKEIITWSYKLHIATGYSRHHEEGALSVTHTT